MLFMDPGQINLLSTFWIINNNICPTRLLINVNEVTLYLVSQIPVQAGNMSLFPSFFTYEQNPSGHSTTTEIKNPQSLQSFQNKKV